MKVFFKQDSPQAVAYAAEELEAYLKKMLPELGDCDWTMRLEVTGAQGTETETALAPDTGARAYRRGNEKEHGCTAAPDRENDSFCVKVTAEGGAITGNRPRSVLLGVYDYLHYLGCRFLMPGAQGEYIPRITKERLPAAYEKTASFYHRGVCIEGADSFENIRDFIAWLPKVGYNSFFLQFKVPYVFLARWYHHEQNPYREAEEFTYADACRYMHLLEAELKKRDLILHKVGHGWTGEVLGYEMSSWETAKEPLREPEKSYAAMVGGMRDLYGGAPTNTNLCLSNPETVERFAGKVTAYAKANPDVDYLHIWLADEYNNVCECEACRRTTPSDQYAALLNEIDRRFCEAHLDTRIAFLLYQELLWPPVKERLKNPQRFVLMFAPISRTFEKSYAQELKQGKNADGQMERRNRQDADGQMERRNGQDADGQMESLCGQNADTLPEYVRNRIVLPSGLGENLAFLRAWQAQFPGDSFVYDYPLGRAHYGDFGYVHIARIIGEDIKKLKEMGLDGYISCQELRAALPNALPNYVMGYTLFEEQTDVQALTEEYFAAAYGKSAGDVRCYLEKLSALQCCDYLNGKGARTDARMAERMRQIQKICAAFHPEAYPEQPADEKDRQREQKSGALPGNPAPFLRELLAFHKEYVRQLAEALELLAEGRQREADESWRNLRRCLCGQEEKFQPYLDVYRVLEVTRKYTGFQ
ncbi:DUF4838 domain-containing protein [Marvinbryantia formatexigens]|nr:DUF4838 domain-containing protein [Marvinbryantia formatexigens]UWO24261.1 DUF4838 domain-containing protein [Marvinbryantia formatexigens DSM 14469]